MKSSIEKMLVDMQLRGMSLGVQQFLRFYDKPVAELSENKIRVSNLLSSKQETLSWYYQYI